MVSSIDDAIIFNYDDFMSFRGEDTRMGFTSHLYDALTRNDIRTYKDDRTLDIGNPIASELLEAIETSRIVVVVLSSSFATSKWCLEETASMKQGNLIAIPVFYHVSPYDVRHHQSNCFEQGFANHELHPENLSEILSKILRNLPDTMPIDLLNSLVGIKSRVDEVKRILRMDSTEVLFIEICGMSGIGKTTLAEAVYKDI